MDWLKKKKARAYEKKVRLIQGRERGAKLVEELIKCCDGKSNPIKFFSPDEILEATDNFSNSNQVLSELDPHYKWYSGKNEKHPMILIKRFTIPIYNLYRQEELFCRDIAISSMVSGQKNFMKLVGCCLECEGQAMVYHGVKKHHKLDLRGQPWIRRIKIAEDIATALAYLHTAFPRPLVYRILSLAKFLLDENGVAKLCDFSLCVSIPQGETSVQVDNIVGTRDYIDHNYFQGLVSEKTDVFAFGILMLNLLTGGRQFHKFFEEGDAYGYETVLEMDVPEITLPKWVSKLVKEPRMDLIADPEMGGISNEEICGMKAFVMLSKRCIGICGEVPTMIEVARELRMIQRSLKIASSSSLSGETQESNPTSNT